MKICFTSYFGLREALKSSTDELAKLGHEILDYPLFMNNIHLETKVDDIVAHFSKFIESHKPDGIFWWCLSIETDHFISIKKSFPNLKYWYFNWDEPYNWNGAELELKAPYFDSVFVSCLESTSRYLLNGCPKAVYCLPGFDPELFFPYIDPIYKTDVSMIMTNLYSDTSLYPDQVSNRHRLVDLIYKGQAEHGYRFTIYGPEFLKELYPDSYQGYCKYTDLNRVFNESRINITTHVVGDKGGYLNERTITLIGSGALILIDNVKQLDLNLKPDRDCLVIDKENPSLQIAEILGNYQHYLEIKKNVLKIRKDHLWNCWAEKINSVLA